MSDSTETAPAIVASLLANRREFLAFVESRVANRVLAEELVQSAFVRALERGNTVRDEESATAWFYRLLKNTVADHYRKQAVEQRADRKLAENVETSIEPEFKNSVCRCVNGLLPELKPEYAGLLERVDMQGDPVQAVAAEIGITLNNATVRLHRARRALKERLENCCGSCATQGCVDCTCATSQRRDQV